MATIGQNFPQTRSARKSLLKNILRDSEPIGNVKVPGLGNKKVYRIKLEFLSYNPYNTRFLAQAKTLETRLGRKLSDENENDLIEIEKFIWSEKKDKNQNTIDSLVKVGQLQPGIVTIDGVILSGNRRFRLLNEITRNPGKYSNYDISNLYYFEAAIIEENLTETDIVRLESFYQYGVEEKVDYDAIQKYIAADRQKNELNFSCDEIARNFYTLTDGKAKKVEEWLEIFEYMKSYLDYIGESDIYTALEKTEESFINLRNTIYSFKNGRSANAIWAFDDNDLADLEARYYDYIRLNTKTHDFRDFKEIFSNQKNWQQFNNNVLKAVTANQVEPFDLYREKYKDESEDEISNIRNRDYFDKTSKSLNALYDNEKRKIIEKKQEETPIVLADKILQKIEKLEEINFDSDTANSQDFYDKIKEIQSRIGAIKQKID